MDVDKTVCRYQNMQQELSFTYYYFWYLYIIIFMLRKYDNVWSVYYHVDCKYWNVNVITVLSVSNNIKREIIAVSH